MIRLFHVYFPRRVVILTIGEALIVYASFLVAALIRFRADSFLMLNYEGGFFKIGLVSGVLMLCMYYQDMYDFMVLGNPREVLTRLVQVLGITCLIMAFLPYLLPAARLEIGFFVLGIVLVGLSVAGWRKVFWALNRSLPLARRAIILGAGHLVTTLAREIRTHAEWGVRVVGYVGRPLDTAGPDELPYLGGCEDLPAVVERERAGQVIVTMEERRGSLPVEPLLKLKAQGVLIQDGAEVYESLTGKISLESLRLSWLLFSPGFWVSGGMLFYKRLTSILISVLGLLLSVPLMAIIAVAIRLDSKGPVIFRQKRVGQDGKVFDLYKFRSMQEGVDAPGQHKPAQENDQRFTRVGRWLRRTRLDELPQLYNILRGDMYFIGPRPFVPNQEEELSQKIPYYRQRWSVRPGATGWAQVNHGYCATVEDNAEKLAYDLFYIKNMSIGLDLLIIFRTAKVLLLGRGSR